MKAIVFTRPQEEDRASVCRPSRDIFPIMQSGGLWKHAPRGFVQAQIERQIGAGIDPAHAARWAKAVAFGGLTEPEVWELVRDRDCARVGILHELQDDAELPDKWFRDAWARSANGGPIGVDLQKARPLQWQRARYAVAQENKRREESFEPLAQIVVPWETLRSAMRHARDEDELRRVWPEGLAA